MRDRDREEEGKSERKLEGFDRRNVWPRSTPEHFTQSLRKVSTSVVCDACQVVAS